MQGLIKRKKNPLREMGDHREGGTLSEKAKWHHRAKD